jgi:hypothetical protein
MFSCDWNVIFSLCLDTYIASEMTIRMVNNELISNAHLCCCYYLSDKEAQAWRRASSLPLSREHCYVTVASRPTRYWGQGSTNDVARSQEWEGLRDGGQGSVQ